MRESEEVGAAPRRRGRWNVKVCFSALVFLIFIRGDSHDELCASVLSIGTFKHFENGDELFRPLGASGRADGWPRTVPWDDVGGCCSEVLQD
jgi:hypothetical protein